MLHVLTRLFYSLQFYILRFAVSRTPTCILGTGARLIIKGRLPFKPGIVFCVGKVVQALRFVNKQQMSRHVDVCAYEIVSVRTLLIVSLNK